MVLSAARSGSSLCLLNNSLIQSASVTSVAVEICVFLLGMGNRSSSLSSGKHVSIPARFSLSNSNDGGSGAGCSCPWLAALSVVFLILCDSTQLMIRLQLLWYFSSSELLPIDNVLTGCFVFPSLSVTSAPAGALFASYIVERC